MSKFHFAVRSRNDPRDSQRMSIAQYFLAGALVGGILTFSTTYTYTLSLSLFHCIAFVCENLFSVSCYAPWSQIISCSVVVALFDCPVDLFKTQLQIQGQVHTFSLSVKMNSISFLF
jgi:hypothetical protein